MIATTSLLDYLKKEDFLLKERDRNFDRQVSLLHTIDDSEDYPSIYSISKDELQKYKEEALTLENEKMRFEKSLRRFVLA